MSRINPATVRTLLGDSDIDLAFDAAAASLAASDPTITKPAAQQLTLAYLLDILVSPLFAPTSYAADLDLTEDVDTLHTLIILRDAVSIVTATILSRRPDLLMALSLLDAPASTV